MVKGSNRQRPESGFYWGERESRYKEREREKKRAPKRGDRVGERLAEMRIMIQKTKDCSGRSVFIVDLLANHPCVPGELQDCRGKSE